MKTQITIFRDGGFDIGAAGVAAGAGVVNNLLDIGFAPIRQRQQLEGQKKALEQQSAANYDYWLKTNYSAQKGQMKQAGLNPALMYGMGGGAGGQSGGMSAMPTQTSQAHGMDIAGAAQLALLKAQTENVKADTAEKRRAAGLDAAGETDLGKVKQDTATGKSTEDLNKQKTQTETFSTLKEKAEASIAETESYIKDKTAEDAIMTVKQSLEKMGEEAQILLDNGKIRAEHWQEYSNGLRAEWMGKILENEAKRAGIALTGAQIAKIQNEIQMAMSHNRIEFGKAMTERQRLEWDKTIKNVSDRVKLPFELVGSIMKGIIIAR